jgi:cell division protein FtsB
VRVTARAGFLLLVVLLVLTLAVAPMRAYLSQRRQLADLQHQTELLQRADTELGARIAQLHDAAYLERLARECLGMVAPGETSFITVPKNGAPQPPDC